MKLHFISMLLFLHLPNVMATSFHAESFESFTSKSKHIVRGTIRRQQVEKTTAPDGTITIYTYALVEVKEPLKGGIHQAEIRVRRLGGETEGYHHEVPGSPEFKEGEDTVLFLTGEQEDGSYEVESMEMGKFGLRMENGAEILTGGMLQFIQRAKNAPEKLVTLGSLREIIRATSTTPPSATTGGAQADTTASPESRPDSAVRREGTTPSEISTPDTTPSTSGLGTPLGALVLVVLALLGWLALRRRRKH
jgi:hypothetical protein